MAGVSGNRGMNANQKNTGQDIHVFLSHASADRECMRRLRSILSEVPHLRVFTTETLSAGENWLAKLKSEISRSDVFVVILSPSSVHSEWVLFELGAALALDKLIIPVLTDPEALARIPLDLRGIQSLEMDDIEQRPNSLTRMIQRYERVSA
jgi:hypothetical protein